LPEVEGSDGSSTPLVLDAQNFRRILIDALNDGMLLLGESSRLAIYIHIEKKYGIKPDVFPEQLERFSKGLQDIFGVGAKILEQSVAKSLYSKLGLGFKEHENWTIVDYVKDARKTVLSFRT